MQHRTFHGSWLGGVLWCLAVGAASGADPVVFPARVELHGSRAHQRVLVQGHDARGTLPPIKTGITFQVTDPAIAAIDGDVLRPLKNGQTTLQVKLADNSSPVQVPLTVTGMDQPTPWSFRNHVQSVLSKTGCNSGACHGAAAGKNGFKLSLRGYDPEADYLALTRHSRGRRIVPNDPGQSLLVTKPTGLIPHKGGVRFEEDSAEYRVLTEWIAEGLAGPQPSDPRLVQLNVLPPHVLFPELQNHTKQPLVVQATFSDGHVEDVTQWVKFSSTNHSVCQVDDRGLVTVTGPGEASIVAWYLAQNAVGTITVPYAVPIAAGAYRDSPRANFIDELVLAKLQSLNLPPTPRCRDEEFLRRSTLDTIGVLPTVEEVREFQADRDPLKRERWVDRLLARPEFVDYWTYFWGDVLLVSGSRLRPDAVKAYDQWLRARVAENTAWDEVVRQLLLVQGGTVEQGAANFYALHQDPQDMAETTSAAFLGMSIQCARCHDHPLEKWTNDDYYGMVSLFARVRGKGWGGDVRSGDGKRTIFVEQTGEVLQPRTGRPQPPRPLEGQPLPFTDTTDRRVALAKWVTSPENPYFTRAAVNRVWANFLGRGLVENVDDLRLTNPASNEPLFAALATHLVQQRYDLKALMRTILLSETYQRSSQALAENTADDRFYSRYLPRRLKAEVILDALSQVTGVPTTFADQPAGTRALQLRDTQVASYFLDTFGRPERTLTCVCERAAEPSMTQVLHLTNGKTLLEKLESPAGFVAQHSQPGAVAEEIVERLYLAALGRQPTNTERDVFVREISTATDEERRAVIEDLYWSVLTSREFLFQH